MSNAEFEAELWLLANAVTAFAVVQAIAGMYAIAKGDVPLRLATRPLFKSCLLAATLTCALVYSYAVWQCCQIAIALPSAHPEIWRQVTTGRVAAIALFQAMAAGGFLVATAGRSAGGNPHGAA